MSLLDRCPECDGLISPYAKRGNPIFCQCAYKDKKEEPKRKT